MDFVLFSGSVTSPINYPRRRVHRETSSPTWRPENNASGNYSDRNSYENNNKGVPGMVSPATVSPSPWQTAPPPMSWNPWMTPAFWSAQMMSMQTPFINPFQAPMMSSMALTPPPTPTTSPVTVDSVQSKKECTNQVNTTLIGDVVFSALVAQQKAWQVQIIGNVTLQAAVDYVQNGTFDVSHRYIFLAIGSNQVYTSNQHDVSKFLHRLVFTIISINAEAKLFIIPVLPRPVDDTQVKQYIIDFNRMLSNATKKLAAESINVMFLSIQNCFLRAGKADDRWYSRDLVSLNQQGCSRLRNMVFEAAGFKKN